MVKPNALILSGYGINCEEETAFAFETAGVKAKIVHINDLVKNPEHLDYSQIFVHPGGFSFGDYNGSGIMMGNRLREGLKDEMYKFIDDGKLVLGICNGFQTLVNAGLLPAIDEKYGERQVGLVHNDSARYDVRWVDLQFVSQSPWTAELNTLSLPIAHGEGKLQMPDSTLKKILLDGHVAARYVFGDICEDQKLLPNPNGSIDNIAGLFDKTGRVFGLMPHPERAVAFTNHPTWTLMKEKLVRQGKEIPKYGPALQLFRNAANYFK